METTSTSEDALYSFLKELVDRVDKEGPAVVLRAITVRARALLDERGLAPGCHVDTLPIGEDLDPVQTAEWAIGQYLSLVDDQAWPIINSWINVTQTLLDTREKRQLRS